MTDIRHASKEFLTEFIEIYRSHPALWKVKSKEYVNRSLKNIGYDALVKFYRKADSKADREFVSKKIQSMRGSFRKELKKFEKFKKSGASGDEQYVPSLWYFDLLLFTREQEMPSDNLHSTGMVDSPSSQIEDDPFSETDDNPNADSQEASINEATSMHRDEEENFKLPAKRAKRWLTSHESEQLAFMKTCTEVLKQCDDLSESAAFGKFVATKHARLSEVQRMYAESLITNVLNRGVLNKLTEHTNVFEMQLPAWHNSVNVYPNSSSSSIILPSTPSVCEETEDLQQP